MPSEDDNPENRKRRSQNSEDAESKRSRQNPTVEQLLEPPLANPRANDPTFEGDQRDARRASQPIGQGAQVQAPHEGQAQRSQAQLAQMLSPQQALSTSHNSINQLPAQQSQVNRLPIPLPAQESIGYLTPQMAAQSIQGALRAQPQAFQANQVAQFNEMFNQHQDLIRQQRTHDRQQLAQVQIRELDNLLETERLQAEQIQMLKEKLAESILLLQSASQYMAQHGSMAQQMEIPQGSVAQENQTAQQMVQLGPLTLHDSINQFIIGQLVAQASHQISQQGRLLTPQFLSQMVQEARGQTPANQLRQAGLGPPPAPRLDEEAPVLQRALQYVQGMMDPVEAKQRFVDFVNEHKPDTPQVNQADGYPQFFCFNGLAALAIHNSPHRHVSIDNMHDLIQVHFQTGMLNITKAERLARIQNKFDNAVHLFTYSVDSRNRRFYKFKGGVTFWQCFESCCQDFMMFYDSRGVGVYFEILRGSALHRPQPVAPNPPALQPRFTNVSLAAIAINNSPDGSLTIHEIYDFILHHFPQHVLNKTSLSKCIRESEHFTPTSISDDLVYKFAEGVTMWDCFDLKCRTYMNRVAETDTKIKRILEGTDTFLAEIQRVLLRRALQHAQRTKDPVKAKLRFVDFVERHKPASPQVNQAGHSPFFCFNGLAALAIHNSPHRHVSIDNIHDFLQEHFARTMENITEDEWRERIQNESTNAEHLFTYSVDSHDKKLYKFKDGVTIWQCFESSCHDFMMFHDKRGVGYYFDILKGMDSVLNLPQQPPAPQLRFTNVGLAAMALHNSPNRSLKLAEICKFVFHHFPQYNRSNRHRTVILSSCIRESKYFTSDCHKYKFAKGVTMWDCFNPKCKKYLQSVVNTDSKIKKILDGTDTFLAEMRQRELERPAKQQRQKARCQRNEEPAGIADDQPPPLQRALQHVQGMMDPARQGFLDFVEEHKCIQQADPRGDAPQNQLPAPQPSFTNVGLAAMALHNSPNDTLKLHEIRKFVFRRFPQSKKTKKALPNCLRKSKHFTSTSNSDDPVYKFAKDATMWDCFGRRCKEYLQSVVDTDTQLGKILRGEDTFLEEMRQGEIERPANQQRQEALGQRLEEQAGIDADQPPAPQLDEGAPPDKEEDNDN